LGLISNIAFDLNIEYGSTPELYVKLSRNRSALTMLGRAIAQEGYVFDEFVEGRYKFKVFFSKEGSRYVARVHVHDFEEYVASFEVVERSLSRLLRALAKRVVEFVLQR